MKTKLLSMIVAVLFMAISQTGYAETLADLEVFDIEKEQVIKRITNTVEIQKEIKQYVTTVDRVVPQFDEVPKKGMMVRIPLQASIQVENQWMKSLVYEVFFIVLPDRDPFIILYDEQRKPYMLQSAYIPKTILKLVSE